MELNVSDADADPGEKGRDGRQVLEPGEDHTGAARGAHECQKRDRCRDGDAVVRNTTAAWFSQTSKGGTDGSAHFREHFKRNLGACLFCARAKR